MKQRAVFPLLALVAAMLAVGCATTQPVSSDLESTTEAGSGEEAKRAVVATTADDPPGKGATVGVASTTEQAEAPSAKTTSETSEVEGAPAEPALSGSSPASFIADPRARGGAGYGADGILGVRYGIHEGYERVVIDLGSGGQPAGSVPEWRLISPKGDGILRVTIPSASTTRVSDGSFSGPLLKNFHVVRASDGGMFVDIFAESAFTYRVIELLDPARIVVDFKPSDAALAFPLPAESDNTVLAQPRRGEQVSGSLTISGYSRNPEASNTVVLTDASGRELVREVVTSNDWAATWGYFETTLDLPPFSGRATLKVGARSARDGSFEGVEIPIYRSG